MVDAKDIQRIKLPEQVIKSIEAGMAKAYEAFLAHNRILSMNKSHKRYWQINKACRLLQPKAKIVLPHEIHQTVTTIKLK